MIEMRHRVGSALTFAYTGKAASPTFARMRAACKPPSAGAIKGEWKAPLTLSLMARFAPAAFASSIAFSTPATSPEITTWPGEL